MMIAHAGSLLEVSLAAYLSLADLLAAIGLVYLLLKHARLVWRNGTTLEPRPKRWDVGGMANAAQVFGERRVWWLVPLLGGPAVNGVDWPERRV